MRTSRHTNIPVSIRQRLLNYARCHDENFQAILTRYGAERFLYRLSQSKYSDKFVLKGASLFLNWTGEFFRPTKKFCPNEMEKNFGKNDVIGPSSQLFIYLLKDGVS